MSHLPPITQGHLIAAFISLQMDAITTLDAALEDELRRKLIVTRAHHLRTQEWAATQHREQHTVRRINPTTGQWITQVVAGDFNNTQQGAQPCLF